MRLVCLKRRHWLMVLIVNYIICISYFLIAYQWSTESSNIYDTMPTTEALGKVHILLCSDEADRFPMYTLINSIIIHEPQPQRLNFHILVLQNVTLFDSETNQYFHQYLDQVTFDYKSITDHHPECIEYNRIASQHIYKKILNHPMNFARFCLPNVFTDVGVGIYLDVDMIVQSSISTLYDKYYSKHHYKAWSVMNRDAMRIVRYSFANPKKETFINNYINTNLSTIYPSVSSVPLNLSGLGAMFNGGMLMFDLNIWRDYKLMQQSLALFKFDTIYKERFRDRPWYGVTQPVINMLFIINNLPIGELNKYWNYVVSDHAKKCTNKWSKRSNRDRFSRANIIHFAGTCKPWITRQAPFSRLWIKYIPQNANVWEWERHFNMTLL
eukprot:755276_1